MSTDIEPLQGRHRAPAATRATLTPAVVLAAAGAAALLLTALLFVLQLREGGL